jgi:small subunit ribosomal protein S19
VTRSSKKEPFVEERLMERILRMNENNKLGEFAPTRTFRTHVKSDRTARRR